VTRVMCRYQLGRRHGPSPRTGAMAWSGRPKRPRRRRRSRSSAGP
jgi:hypothetical protein